ncbi:TPA: hypothetical protein N0F65_007786 [Lagenidium giganteum]|uniref:Deleted in lung and esophageal cancer protein 1 Ig-like domain-containing protein n=1 Tax=Lagenidium giganteum TaxID=4803 RepID=A0AAV2YYS1_9STRA|nr:TPA: hypothetical protein N0F65_007786 [Lagenidium giganteum]
MLSSSRSDASVATTSRPATSAAASTGAEPEEHEIVAVGTVSHVIRRAFRQFYVVAEPEKGVVPNNTPPEPVITARPPSVMSARPVTAVAASVPTTARPNAAAAAAAAATPPAAIDTSSPAENEDANLAEGTDNNAADVEPPNPFVLFGEEQKRGITATTDVKQKQAKSLLSFLESRHAEARQQDEEIARELSRQGLVVKAQIPMGPSTLKIDENQVQALGGWLADNLVNARTLIASYDSRKRDLTGNGPQWIARQAVGIIREPPGYLVSTSSFDSRKQSTLQAHEQHIKTAKEITHGGSRRSDTDPANGSEHSRASGEVVAKRHEPAMSATEKRKNMEILKRMQTKLDFLRNPRYMSAKPDPPHDTAGNNNGSDAAASGAPAGGALFPRSQAAAKEQVEEDAEPPSTSASFAAMPNPVEFTDYDVGGIYEQTVLIRNNSRLSRRVRVLPPASFYFALDRVTYPDQTGLVAPGMSVQVRVRFAPDSRADYKDAMAVFYESDNAGQRAHFILPIRAHRKPPELSIPLVLRAQNTLVGSRSVTKIPCTNVGGKGRFWLMTEKDWARHETNLTFRSDSKHQFGNGTPHVSVGPFRLTPNDIELGTGESVDFELMYVPTGVGEQREKFVVVCDNCLVRTFQLIGRGCQVELSITGVNGKTIDTEVTHMGTVDHIFFDTVVLHQHTEQRLEIQNETPIDLEFAWKLEPPDEIAHTVMEAPPFAITPATGTFPHNAPTQFVLSFKPTTAQQHHWRAVLSICNIPACSIPGPRQIELLAQTFQHIRKSPMTATIEHEDAVPSMEIALKGVGQLGSFSLVPPVLLLPENSAEQSPRHRLLQKSETYTATVGLQNDGASVVAYRWDPSRVVLRNASTALSLTTLSGLFDLTIEPQEGEMLANGYAEATLTFTPRVRGAFSIALPCVVPSATNAEFERWLLVEGVVETARIEFTVPEVDFGLVLVGSTAEYTFSLRNPTAAATAWRIFHLEAWESLCSQAAMHAAASAASSSSSSNDPHSLPKLKRMNSNNSVSSRHSHNSASSGNSGNSGNSGSLFTSRDSQPRATVAFCPDQGQLNPNEVLHIRAVCSTGALPERFRGSFACQLAAEALFSGRKTSEMAVVSARAEIQSPNVYLTPTKILLGTTYLGVSVRRTLHLINISNLAAIFKFVEPQGTSKAYSVEFSPRSGTIESKQNLVVTMTYTPRQAGKTTALFACTVRGLLAPLGFEVSTNQKGLVLSYELLSKQGPPPKSPKQIAMERGINMADCDLEPETSLLVFPKLQFGESIPLCERRTLRFIIRNFSGIEAKIEVDAKRHPAAAIPPGTSTGSASTTVPNTVTGRGASSANNSNNSIESGDIVRKTNSSSSQGFGKIGLQSTKSPSPRKRKPILSDAHERENRFQSDNGHVYARRSAENMEDRAILAHGHGVALQVSPAQLHIPPWEQAVVTVTCFNNMPGMYADDIVCRPTGAPPVFLHANATVVGTPLALDRNCVGLYYPKRITDPSKEAKSALPGQPTLHVGDICVRSAPVTRTLRVINRGPRPARLKWKLVENGKENQLVTVTLHLDFTAKVQIRIVPVADEEVEFPFDITPSEGLIPQFSTVPFKVTYTPPENPERARLLLLGDAHWLQPLSNDSSGTALHTPESDDLSITLPSEAGSPPRSTDSEKTSSSSKLRKVTMLAAGKALKAVRVANTLARRAPAQRSTNAASSSVSAKCLRILLAANVVEPELFLDKSQLLSGMAGLQAQRNASAGYHVKFTTWSTIATAASTVARQAQVHPFHRREFTLLNHLNARLTFRLECTGPFYVYHAESMAPRHPLASAGVSAAHRKNEGESYIFTLPPRMSVRVDLRFDAANCHSVVAARAAAHAAASGPTSPKADGTAGAMQKLRLKQHVEGALFVRFTNQSAQCIQLVGEILRPLLSVSPSIYNFGHVHLCQTRRVVLRLTNPTVVPAAFTVRHVPLPIPISRAQKQEMKLHHSHATDDPSVFEFQAMEGELEGPTTSIRSAGGALPRINALRERIPEQRRLVHTPLELSVLFRPKEVKRYKSRFRFVVASGNDFEVVLEGAGHLHEQEIHDQERAMVKTSLLEHSSQIYGHYKNK